LYGKVFIIICVTLKEFIASVSCAGSFLLTSKALQAGNSPGAEKLTPHSAPLILLCLEFQFFQGLFMEAAISESPQKTGALST